MIRTDHRSSRRSGGRALVAGVALLSLAAAACSDDNKAATPTDAAVTTTAATTDTTPATEPTGTEPTGTEPVTTELGPATGEPIVVGLVNTEGTPGLDFPDIRLDMLAAADYLNDHGGFGGRPIQLEPCIVKGSPETSQACAQELVGKNVEMVMLGLDLFPDYATYGAAEVPVFGVLPILPGDYTAEALFLTGGNATVNAAMAAVAKDHFDAKTVNIVSSDNPGANASEAALTASLDIAGIAHKTVKGGDNETDAGYQGLMREAAKDNPDLLVSLYSDAGCIGTMRGRAALGITIPVITTGICSSKDVLVVVGDDAVGWMFAGVQTSEDTPERALLQEILAPVIGVDPADVDPSALGLGGLGFIEIMSLADYSQQMAAAGTPVTGASLFDFLKTAQGLTLWPQGSGSPIECSSVPAYSAVCSFILPFAEYQKGGEVLTVPGLEAVSSKDYLP